MPRARIGNPQSKIFKHIEILDASRMASQMVLTILDVISDSLGMALGVREALDFFMLHQKFPYKKGCFSFVKHRTQTKEKEEEESLTGETKRGENISRCCRCLVVVSLSSCLSRRLPLHISI